MFDVHKKYRKRLEDFCVMREWMGRFFKYDKRIFWSFSVFWKDSAWHRSSVQSIQSLYEEKHQYLNFLQNNHNTLCAVVWMLHEIKKKTTTRMSTFTWKKNPYSQIKLFSITKKKLEFHWIYIRRLFRIIEVVTKTEGL